MTKTETDILNEARATIADPERWVTGNYAVNQYGSTAHPWDNHAVRWCAIGAIEKVKVPHQDWSGTAGAKQTLRRAALDLFSMSVPAVNDRLGHESVMSMYDHAIKSLEEADAADDATAA